MCRPLDPEHCGGRQLPDYGEERSNAGLRGVVVVVRCFLFVVFFALKTIPICPDLPARYPLLSVPINTTNRHGQFRCGHRRTYTMYNNWT